MKANRPAPAVAVGKPGRPVQRRHRRLRTRSGLLIDGVSAVLGYLASGGDPCAPHAYVDAEGIRIGAIIVSIRQRQRMGILPVAVARHLERVPGWTWRVLDRQFEEGFAQLQAYAVRHRDSRVPEGYRAADGYHVAQFVSYLRRKHRTGGLTPAQVHRIDALPQWAWEPFVDDWNDCFAVLAAHLAHGGAVWGVPWSLTSRRGHSIRNWAYMQRRTRVVMRATHPDRHAQLSGLAGWEWECDRWGSWHVLLLAFAAKHGHARVRQHQVVGGRRLGAWVSQQRYLYARGELQSERVALLAAVPGWLWDASLLSWQSACDELAAYVDTHGHSAVPYAFTTRTKFSLGVWVSRVRALLRDGSLDPQRAALVLRAVRDEHVIVARSMSSLVRTGSA